jgi:hypothetical protein
LETAEQDAEQLLNYGLSLLERHISKWGEFIPVAFVLTDDGNPAGMAAAYQSENATAVEQLELLREGLRERAASDASVRAIAIFIDSMVQRSPEDKKVEAVRAAIDHRSGFCVDIFVPYTRSEGGEVVFGETYVTNGEWPLFDRAN